MATVALQSAARGSGAAGPARGERPHGTELPKFRLSPKVPPEPSRAAPRAPSPGPTAAHGGPLFSPGRAGLRAAGILPPPRQRVVRPPKPQVCAVAPALSTDVQLRAPHCERDPPPAWGKDLKRKKKKKKGEKKPPQHYRNSQHQVSRRLSAALFSPLAPKHYELTHRTPARADQPRAPCAAPCPVRRSRRRAPSPRVLPPARAGALAAPPPALRLRPSSQRPPLCARAVPTAPFSTIELSRSRAPLSF